MTYQYSVLIQDNSPLFLSLDNAFFPPLYNLGHYPHHCHWQDHNTVMLLGFCLAPHLSRWTNGGLSLLDFSLAFLLYLEACDTTQVLTSLVETRHVCPEKEEKIKISYKFKIVMPKDANLILSLLGDTGT